MCWGETEITQSIRDAVVSNVLPTFLTVIGDVSKTIYGSISDLPLSVKQLE